jgi:uncharacterized alpha-E superfamily protein
MLSRTADSLYWLGRYVERAENIARIVLAGYRLASMSRSIDNPGNEWLSTLRAAGCDVSFARMHGEATAPAAIDFLVRDPDNPSSICSCYEVARRNARAVRTALTVDMWDALNDTWHQLKDFGPASFTPERVTDFLEWAKERSLLFNGAYGNTMLRNDAFSFTRIGTFIERADNTARILDVKYHVLLPSKDMVGGVLDYYQWQTILGSVSALRGYHWVYHERLKPWLIAELLILRPEAPRSLRSCLEQIALHLDLLANAYGGERRECHRLAGEMNAKLRYGRIGDVFQAGLHEYLSEFIARIAVLGNEISNAYLR